MEQPRLRPSNRAGPLMLALLLAFAAANLANAQETEEPARAAMTSRPPGVLVAVNGATPDVLGAQVADTLPHRQPPALPASTADTSWELVGMVPGPASLLLFAFGLLALVVLRERDMSGEHRRRRHR